MSRDQLDLFGAAPRPASGTSTRQSPPARARRARSSGRPEVAADVLAEVHQGRYGMLDDSDRYVVFEDDTRVRLAADDNVLASLTAGDYIERRPVRDTVTCRHGAVRRPVTPLRLTRRGHALLNRWQALTPAKPMKITGGETTMHGTSGHTAHAVDKHKPYGRWRVSWLPGRTVSHNQATTALVLAEHVAAGATGPGHRHWAHVTSWAGELDLTPAEAVAAVRRAIT
ncbi:hypothetical protein [Actinophytocola xanthii]|uniref:hypothetical protein n=1 Tax=Actinophytocola xanthii TaxID=1912961 RepID=UPI0011779D3C|nr:hypothetical protein [Actinophytocola xanthii]